MLRSGSHAYKYNHNLHKSINKNIIITRTSTMQKCVSGQFSPLSFHDRLIHFADDG